jgi:hypothetical protein|tara:strand:- start:3 stop:242 length:240 start_codon:yes stop_codon:yes gene_type:complete
MLIHINVEEFEKDFQEPWKARLIKFPSIDYATNCIHGWFENKDIIIFKFNNYGFVNDNKSNTYSLSSGDAGITILIKNS